MKTIYTKRTERPYGYVENKGIKSAVGNTHIYEIPASINQVLVTNKDGELLAIQTRHSEQKLQKVIYAEPKTIVILEDGTVGIAKCNPSDCFKRQIGYDIAYNRAKIKQLEKQLKSLIK